MKPKRSGMVSFGGVKTLQLFYSDTISLTFGVFYFRQLQSYCVTNFYRYIRQSECELEKLYKVVTILSRKEKQKKKENV